MSLVSSQEAALLINMRSILYTVYKIAYLLYIFRLLFCLIETQSGDRAEKTHCQSAEFIHREKSLQQPPAFLSSAVSPTAGAADQHSEHHVRLSKHDMRPFMPEIFRSS